MHHEGALTASLPGAALPGIWKAGIIVYIEFLRDRLPTPLFLGFPNSSDGKDSDGKESACSVGDLGSIPGLGRSSLGWEDPLEKGLATNPSALT